MFRSMKRFLFRGKKGFEALQAVLLLGAAFFVIMAIKNFTTSEVMPAATKGLPGAFAAQ
jgi:hypothetical protein